MRPDLILWAVPLDAVEPNFIYEGGRILDPQADALRRQEIVAKFSRISGAAKPVATGGQTKVNSAGGQLTLMVPIEERDEMGRVCPVTLLLQKNSLSRPNAVDEIADELIAVLRSSERTVDEPDVRATLANLADRVRRSPQQRFRSAWAALQSLLELAARFGLRVLRALVAAVIRWVRHLLAPAPQQEQEQAREREAL